MRSIAFPNIFKGNSTNIVSDNKATLQNLKLLLGSEKGEFTGDPYYGVRLKRYLFDLNNTILKDVLIDEIYTQIKVFMPQINVERKNIKIINNPKGEKARLSISIKAMNKLDYTINTYNLVLYEGD